MRLWPPVLLILVAVSGCQSEMTLDLHESMYHIGFDDEGRQLPAKTRSWEVSVTASRTRCMTGDNGTYRRPKGEQPGALRLQKISWLADRANFWGPDEPFPAPADGRRPIRLTIRKPDLTHSRDFPYEGNSKEVRDLLAEIHDLCGWEELPWSQR